MSSIVRRNLMNRKGYSPYCGNSNCREMPRTSFNGEQFTCSCCGWTSGFDKKFIQKYKEKWAMKGKSNG